MREIVKNKINKTIGINEINPDTNNIIGAITKNGVCIGHKL